MTKTIDTQQIKQNIDLRELAGRYTELRRASGDMELCGPCPKCGGHDRFHCTANWFMCRKCHPKRSDAIEFVRWLERLDFKSALAWLTNAPTPTVAPARREPTIKHRAVRSHWNQRRAENEDKVAYGRLMDDADQQAQAGRLYLESRGFLPHTWQIYHIGFTYAALPGTWDEDKKAYSYPKQPAITIPWYRNGKLCAIRHRFLKEHKYPDVAGNTCESKISSFPGSNFTATLYGGQVLDISVISLWTLLIIEGEINAKSVWQVAHDTRLCVLSLGGQDSQITPAMAAYAAQFGRVIVWLDQKERAQKAMAVLPGAYGIKSPLAKDENGQNLFNAKGKPIELDANKLLQAGELGEFLATHRFLAAGNRHEQERLLWDLWDAAQLPMGVDALTNNMIQEMASTLGIELNSAQPIDKDVTKI